jgi:hypothetical protein
MMLFDPEEGPSIKGGSVAGKQEWGREIMKDNEEDNECKSKTKTEFEECQVVPGMRPEKGHLSP